MPSPAITSVPPPSQETSDNRIQVRFTTNNSKYAHLLPTTPIYIPTRLRRFGLSEIIHHLVSTVDENKKPFDFLIDGQLLTTSVQKYLDMHHISLEHVLEMECVESVMPPQDVTTVKQDDWISDIDATTEYICVGLYDKTARLYNMSGHCMATVSHESVVKAVKMVVRDQGVTLFVGGQDGIVKGHLYDQGVVQHVTTYQGHTGGIEAIRMDPTSTYMATCSTDGHMCLFDADISVPPRTSSSKRKREEILVSPRVTLQGHHQTVSGLVFDKLGHSSTLYSGSWDHTVRQWDTEQQANVTTMNCENVVLDIDQSRMGGLLATGHTDRVVRLWDPRVQEGMVVKLKLVSHHNWTSRVAWSPLSAYHVASSSYDGTCKLWDIRSNATPLYSIHSVEEPGQKVFALAWSETNHLYSGGEDTVLRVHQCHM